MADPIEVELSKRPEVIDYFETAMEFGGAPHNANGFDRELHPTKVFLLTHGNDECARGGELYVSNNPFRVIDTIDTWMNEPPLSLDTSIIHLQEYASFESAYSVALAMREGHPLCYNQ